MRAPRSSGIKRKVLVVALLAVLLLVLISSATTAKAEEAVVVEAEEVLASAPEAHSAAHIAEAVAMEDDEVIASAPEVDDAVHVEEVEVEEVLASAPEAHSTAHVAEAVVIEEAPLDADKEMTAEEAAAIVAEMEANAAKVAAEARAASSIREPLTYEGVGAIHWAAKVRAEGCAAVTQEYLDVLSARTTASGEKVRRARADLNEARSHAPEKVAKAEQALARAKADADAAVRKTMKEFGGDMQKTCVTEVHAALMSQLMRAQEMKNNFIATWSRHFSMLQGSYMMLYRTGQGVVAHLLESWYPTYDAAWDFLYLYTEKALSAFDKAREPAYMGGERDFVTNLGLYARGFSYAMVPVLTGAVLLWVVVIFWPLLLLGFFGPSFFHHVWWRVFILWNMYGLTFPTGYINALLEYKTLLMSKQYSTVFGRAADAFFDVIGEDAEETFYNGMVMVFSVWCCVLACIFAVWIWLACFKRCARISRPRRRQAPTYPRRSPAPKVAPAAGAAKPKSATKTATKTSTKSAPSASAKKKN